MYIVFAQFVVWINYYISLFRGKYKKFFALRTRKCNQKNSIWFIVIRHEHNYYRCRKKKRKDYP